MKFLSVLLFIHFFFIQNCSSQNREVFYGLVSATVLIDFPSNEDCSAVLYRDSSNVYMMTACHNLFLENETMNEFNLKYESFILSNYLISTDKTLKRIKSYK